MNLLLIGGPGGVVIDIRPRGRRLLRRLRPCHVTVTAYCTLQLTHAQKEQQRGQQAPGAAGLPYMNETHALKEAAAQLLASLADP
jgi:hypothetical protein